MAGDINVVITHLDAAKVEAEVVKVEIDTLKQQIATLTQERDAAVNAVQPYKDALLRVKARAIQRQADDAASVDGKADADDVASVGL